MLQSNAQILPDEEEQDETREFAPIEETNQENQADATPAPEDTSTETIEPPPEEAEVPEPLRGKSQAELARMYLEAQKLIGRHGQEIGELRRATDALIKRELSKRAPAEPKPAPKPVEDVDFFANPKDAVQKAIEDSPSVKKLREENAALLRDRTKQSAEAATAKFNQLHPDAAAVLHDPEFQAWVGKSEIRKKLLVAAHTRYDVDAADEVLSTWKELKASKTPAAPKKDAPPSEAAKKAASAAAVPSGGNASPKAGGGNAGKIYRRADVMRLMEEDPDRYEALADEIRLAYEQGRVR